MASPIATATPANLRLSSSSTATLTLDEASSSSSSQPQALTLKLVRKKKVTWKEGTVDNEFMNKKKSKKCCIFHRDKPFDEDNSDDEDDRSGVDHHGNGDGDGCCSKGN